MTTHPPTIRDVAKAAGVAIGTVSRILNGAENIRPAHLAGVKEAIARLGYQPRPPGAPRGPRHRNNARRRTFQIAFLSPGIYGSLAHVPVYLSVLHGVQAAAEAGGLSVMLGTNHPETRRESGALRARVDGAIVLGLDRKQALRLTQGAPCVQVMGARVAMDDLRDQVTYDNAAIGPLAADHLLRRGHPPYAFLGDVTAPLGGERLQGFRRALEQAGTTPVMLNAEGAMALRDRMNVTDMDRLAALVDRLLAEQPTVTGLFAESDHWLGPLYALFYQRGVRPGRDIELIGCNRELPLLNALHPRPATIDIHAEEVGRQAVGQLIARMADPFAPPVHIAIPPAIVPGEEPPA
jgi:LacI family transcriptional regulator